MKRHAPTEDFSEELVIAEGNTLELDLIMTKSLNMKVRVNLCQPPPKGEKPAVEYGAFYHYAADRYWNKEDRLVQKQLHTVYDNGYDTSIKPIYTPLPYEPNERFTMRIVLCNNGFEVTINGIESGLFEFALVDVPERQLFQIPFQPMDKMVLLIPSKDANYGDTTMQVLATRWSQSWPKGMPLMAIKRLTESDTLCVQNNDNKSAQELLEIFKHFGVQKVVLDVDQRAYVKFHFARNMKEAVHYLRDQMKLSRSTAPKGFWA